MSRQTLPQRRRAETFSVVHRNHPVTITIGFFPDGRIGEIFISTGKSGADIENIAHDAAVAISLALQHGVSVASIQHAVTRDGNGAPLSILGAVVDRLATRGAP